MKEGSTGHSTATTFVIALANWQHEIRVVWNRARLGILGNAFGEQHRVFIPDRRLEHPFSIVSVRWTSDIQTGEMCKDRLRAVGMRRGCLNTPSSGRADNQRRGELPVKHLMDLRRQIDDGI